MGDINEKNAKKLDYLEKYARGNVILDTRDEYHDNLAFVFIQFNVLKGEYASLITTIEQDKEAYLRCTEFNTASHLEETQRLYATIESQVLEIAKWKEKEFAACSKHHEFIDEIELKEATIESKEQFAVELCKQILDHEVTIKSLQAENQKINKNMQDEALFSCELTETERKLREKIESQKEEIDRLLKVESDYKALQQIMDRARQLAFRTEEEGDK